MRDILQQLYKLIEQRKENGEEGSYTTYLFDKGIDKILKKCGEETAEMIIAVKNNDKEEIIAETCDLIYHMFVMLNACGISLQHIEAELEKRSCKTGNLKKSKDIDKNS